MKEENILRLIDINQTTLKALGDDIIVLQNKVQAMQKLLVENDKKVNELWLSRD